MLQQTPAIFFTDRPPLVRKAQYENLCITNPGQKATGHKATLDKNPKQKATTELFRVPSQRKTQYAGINIYLWR